MSHRPCDSNAVNVEVHLYFLFLYGSQGDTNPEIIQSSKIILQKTKTNLSVRGKVKQNPQRAKRQALASKKLQPSQQQMQTADQQVEHEVEDLKILTPRF